MKIAKVDVQGRVSLKKILPQLPEYFDIEEDKQRIILTPLWPKDIEDAANFLKRSKK
jgi:hypothetical protein